MTREFALRVVCWCGAGLWTDRDFPPDRSSLCFDWSQCSSPSVWSKLVWRRAVEFCDGEPEVFFDGITPSDIEQGLLGDCYFLSTSHLAGGHTHTPTQ